MIIKSKETGEVIGKVVTNQSLTFDETMRLAGFEWKEYDPENGIECRGWYDGDVLLDESVVEIEAE